MKICFRDVQESDVDLLFQWANDPVVRKNSFNTNFIKYKDHINWFKGKLKEVDNYHLIIMNDKIPIGQIRVDIHNRTPEISYTISEEFRGKGFGKLVLTNIGEFLKVNKFNYEYVIGKVKTTNIASIKCFENAGFTAISNNNNVITYKKVIII